MKVPKQYDLFTRRAVLPDLTPCECVALRAVAGGETQKSVADKLGVHVRTLEFHLANIRRKFKRVTTWQCCVELILSESVVSHSSQEKSGVRHSL